MLKFSDICELSSENSCIKFLKELCHFDEVVFRGFLSIPIILTELRSEKFEWFDPSPIEPFNSGESAMSYFVGAKNVDGGIEEDGGFAINGGRGWSDVVFTNHQIDVNGNTAIAMGMFRKGPFWGDIFFPPTYPFLRYLLLGSHMLELA